MNLDQPTLIQFELNRKENNFIPPAGSNSFYNIGSGKINLLTKNDDIKNYQFDISTNSGQIYTGIGNYIISKNINISPYNKLTVIANTKLSVNSMLTIDNGELEIHGDIELMEHSHLIIKNNSIVTLYIDSVFVINNNTEIIVENGSSLIIYGRIDSHISMVDSILNVKGIIIDSAAVMNVSGLDLLGERPFSLTDYDMFLRNKIINVYTQGEQNFSYGRIGYTWTGGSPLEHSQIIRMSVLWGEAILGDFKLSILGTPSKTITNLQMISELHICKNTTLYIKENYHDKRYMRPELYLGIVIGNNDNPAKCIVDGSIICDGVNSIITIDRGSSMYINENGKLYLKNNAIMRSTYNDNNQVLFIDGELIIDTIEQINSFNKNNIVIGDNGKVIILNPDTGENKLLWTTPNGIENSDLYRLFKDRINHVEYHISKNNGIGIDKYYEFYAREMTNWYGGMRIEKAIHEGLIVWHDGGFIELYHDIIPWVNKECTLLHASRIFKTFGSYDKDKLQDVVNRLRYAGCGNILFRFIDGEYVKEVTLVLEGINMTNIVKNHISDMYLLTTDNDGKLFIKNNVSNTTVSNIINKNSLSLDIIDNELNFQLPKIT